MSKKRDHHRGRTPLTLQLNAIPIGGIDLFAPRSEVTREIDGPIHQAIVDRFSVGTLTDGSAINALFSTLTDLYSARFQSALNEAASMTLLGLALGQYDLTALLEKRFKAHALSETDAKLWRNHGPMVRRSIKWLCESLARRSELPNDPPARTATCIEVAWHIAEEMVRCCEMSDQTRYIAPDVSAVTIHPVGNPQMLTPQIQDFDDQFFKRIETSRDNEASFLPDSLTSQEIDSDLATLDPVFSEQFGITYDTLLTTFVSLIEHMPSETTGFDIPETRFSDVATQFAKNLGVPRDVGRTLLDGFTIDKTRLDAENRKVWETHTHYRLFRRGMIVVRRDGKAVITWSRAMARGALNQLGVTRRPLCCE